MKFQIKCYRRLCPIHELVTGQIDETASQSWLFNAFRLSAVYRSFRALLPFSSLFCLPTFLHVKLEVEHWTFLAKVTGSNFIQILAIPMSYFRVYLTTICSCVFESLLLSSDIVLHILLYRMFVCLTTLLLSPNLKISMWWTQRNTGT